MRLGEIAVTVDVVLLGIVEGQLQVLLVERAREPFRGKWAIPGGFVEPEERLEAAAARELAEETGLTAPSLRLVGVYDDPGRDPRGRVVSIAYWGAAHEPEGMRGGDDAARAFLTPVEDLEPATLAFDHHRIVSDALGQYRAAQANSSDARDSYSERGSSPST